MRSQQQLFIPVRLALVASIIVSLVVGLFGVPQVARAVSPNVVISQVYGGGGNSGATLRNDFIELFNRGTAAVDLSTWSVQYASSTGTSWARTNLNGSIAPGGYYLIQQAQGAGGTVNLPTPNATGTIAMSATSGKVALVNSTTTIGAVSCPGAAEGVVDFVGYGSANCSETTPTATLSNTTAAIRNGNGCVETDVNSSDFVVGEPNPRNSSSPLNPCGSATPNLSINDVTAAEGNTGTTTFSFTVSLSSPAGTGGVTFDIATADNTATTADNDYVARSLTGQTIPEGSSSYTFDVTVNGDTTVEPNETFFVNVTNIVGANPIDSQGLGTITNDDASSLPTVTITATDPTASETGPDTGTFTVTRSGDTTAALVVNYTIGGTAAADDYTPTLGGTVEIPAGETSAAITITPVDDTLVEGSETLILTLAAGAGYDLGTPNSATVTIADNDVSVTRIHAIQGSGPTVTGPGPFTVEAIVVGDFQTQGSGQLRGFFLQEEDADADANPATSEGIFVFCNTCPVDVAVGDLVRVTGSASEFFGMSQLTASTADSITVLNSGNPLPTPATPTLPVPGVPDGNLSAARAVIDAYFEQFEGMLVRFETQLAIAEYFELARYGQLVLSAGGRPRQFTDLAAPSVTGFTNHQIDFAKRTIILDDTNNVQNDAITGTDKPYFWPRPGLSITNRFRGGDTITNLTGVLHWSFAGQTGTDAWRIRPVEPAFSYTFTSTNPRPPAPNLSGSVTVAAYNVLNYFLTIDETASSTSGPCGANRDLDCRGPDSVVERDRQQTKLTQALLGLDADIVGLIEMENTPGVTPTLEIVNDLNAVPGTIPYSFIDTGVIGTDAIRVGIIYRPSIVTPVGVFKILDSSVDPEFDSSRSRPALAQTFRENASGAIFTVVVNHFKSKGDSGLGGTSGICTTQGPGADVNCDKGDGQGFWNDTRTKAAQALARWLATDPTNSGDPDFMIIGDLNAYRNEDPVTALEAAGYIDLIDTRIGASAYSFLFSGQLGYLDHALASPSLAAQVTAVDEWHINADEPPLLDYNDEVRDVGEATFERESAALPLYAPDAFRTSDHDPVIVGLNLTTPNRAPVAVNDSATTPEDTPVTIDVLANDSDPDPGTTLTVQSVTQPSNGTAEIVAGGVKYTPNANFNGSDSFSYTISDGALTASATVTVNVTPVNDPPVANDDTVTTPEDTALNIPLADLLANDTDPDTGDTLTVISVGPAQNGSVELRSNDGVVNYRPAANFNGTDSFTYTIQDSAGATASATVTVNVTPVNDAPRIAYGGGDAVCPAGNGTSGIGYFFLVGDPDQGDTLTLSVTDAPSWLTSATFSPVSGNPAARQLTLNLANNTTSSVRRATVNVVVTDGGGLSASLPLNLIIGTPGDDRGQTPQRSLTGTEGVDIILGLGGDDVSFAKGGDDLLCGGSGNDLLYGEGGNDAIYPGSGNDIAEGGAGNDLIVEESGNNILAGGDGDDRITGGSGNDIINGDAGNDTLNGAGGNDQINGGDGNDIINGGNGNDALNGGNGNDIINGGDGNDNLVGGEGNDILDGGAGNDSLSGGDGDDILTGGPGRDSFDGGPGTDRATDRQPNEPVWEVELFGPA